MARSTTSTSWRVCAWSRTRRTTTGSISPSATSSTACRAWPKCWARSPTSGCARRPSGCLSDEEKAKIQGLGGFEELMRTLAQRLAEQEKRHQGGSKMIGTAGTSPVRRLWLQPGGRADRAGRQPPPARGQGLGPAAVPQPCRRCRGRHPQPQAGAAQAAPLRPRGRRRGARSRRDDPRHRAQCRAARPAACGRSGTTRSRC